MNAVKKEQSPHMVPLNSSSISKTIKAADLSKISSLSEPGNKTSATVNSDNKCEWDGKTILNHTLVGGINSGEFREHTQATNMSQCMGQCCKEEDCDLSFMIDNDCYTVKCTRSDLCQTRKAKTTSFIPKIAFKKRTNVIVERKCLKKRKMKFLRKQCRIQK